MRTASRLLASLAMLAPASALTADYEPPLVIEQDPEVYEEVVPVEIGSGWYLRGDIGYKWYNDPDAHYDVSGYGDFIDESLSNTGIVGVGFGYKFNESFRTDVTLDYEWPGDFHGRLICPSGPCDPDTYSDEYAKIAAWTGLFNVYWDLGTIAGEGPGVLTPYIGAGIGASYLVTSNVNYVNPDSSTGSWDGAGKWNLAWALMAGVSYAVSKDWLFDLNYRYVHLGNAVSGSTTDGVPIKYDNINASEIRFGVRYMIN